MSKKVAVVILNWNGIEFLKQFIPSVVNFSNNEASVIVADNNSTDNSVEYLKANHPSVQIVTLDKNYGFAGGYNNALKQINAEYYVLLNSDVEVTENWLTPLITLMDSNDEIAACQPKIKAYHNKNSFEYAGAAGGFIDNLGYPFCRGRIFDNTETDQDQYNDSTEIFWASGASLFIRAKLYHSIGGLDEYFFAHMEEIDLCWRLKNKGLKIMFEPNSTVYHVGGGTLDKSNPRKTFLNYRNSLLMLHKNLSKKVRFTTIFKRLALDGISSFQLLITGKPLHSFAILRAHTSYYFSLSQNRKKRTNTEKFNSTGMIDLNIVYAYFVKKQKTFVEILK